MICEEKSVLKVREEKAVRDLQREKSVESKVRKSCTAINAGGQAKSVPCDAHLKLKVLKPS